MKTFKKLLVYNPDERLSAKQALQHIYFQDITDNKYYNQYFIGNYQKNSLIKNIGNDSLSMIKSVDDSPGNNHKIKGITNKLSNKNMLNKGSSDNLMINNNQNNSLNKIYNSNNNSNIEQYSQRNMKDSLENIENNNNSFKKDNINNNNNYKIKLPKILKIKFNNINTNNTNMNSNNIMGNYKNHANIGGINYDIPKNINNSIDYNSNISYIKGVSMTKKMNILKSKYVSPYSKKAIIYNPQKFGKQ